MLCRLCGSGKLVPILIASNFDIIECSSCKIAFTEPPPSVPEYENMDFHSGEDPENAEKLTSLTDLSEDWQGLIRLQTKMIAKQFKKNINILEVGCGEGILLDELRQEGYCNVAGVEPSRTGASRAQQRGLYVINKYFSSEVVKEKYDLIIMSHVFEHIENPSQFIDELTAALTNNGALMLTQTNFKGLIPRFLKENWYAWVPDQHFWHFTEKGLAKMFKTKGLNLISSGYTSLVHPHNWLYKLSNLNNSFKDQFIVIFKKYA